MNTNTLLDLWIILSIVILALLVKRLREVHDGNTALAQQEKKDEIAIKHMDVLMERIRLHLLTLNDTLVIKSGNLKQVVLYEKTFFLFAKRKEVPEKKWDFIIHFSVLEEPPQIFLGTNGFEQAYNTTEEGVAQLEKDLARLVFDLDKQEFYHATALHLT